LFELFISAQAGDFDAMPLPEEHKKALLHMQFEAQHASYRDRFPGASHDIILLDMQPIGRLYVARSVDEIRLVDIALLPAQRGLGLGTKYVSALVDEGKNTGLPLRLSVALSNPAQYLYLRLGFRATGDDGVYIAMENSSILDPGA
jgi:ribosomal protein S18 acetylase RimI-like enzyme